jgi:hypothetical protein
MSGMASSSAMAAPFSVPRLSSSWQYIEGPDSPRETACRVIAGYSIWKPVPFVPMKARTLEIIELSVNFSILSLLSRPG